MKKVLLGTTALLGAGLVASPAFAADGIKLGLGGFFKSAFLVNFDDDSEGEAGNERNTTGFFSDSEVHFLGSTVLDNGLEVGARIELEGENNDNDQVDEAWVYFSGGFGEVRIGSQDDALGKLCLLPPGGTGNFSAFSPPEWAANTLTSNSVCTGVSGDAQKILYISPVFAGFQLGASFTPSAGDEDQFPDVGGPHVGMPTNVDGESRNNLATYLTYTFAGDAWGLSAGVGGAWEGHVEQAPAGPDRDEASNYQAALNLTFGNFGVGGVIQYYKDATKIGDDTDIDAWVAGAGVSYTVDAWTVGAQYSHADSDNDGEDGGDDSVDRAIITGNYAMGPGINVDAEVAYTWADADDGGARFANDALNNYDSLEIGLGTVITF